MIIEESTFQSALVSALDAYVKQVDPTNMYGGCYTPSHRNQSPRDLKGSFDLAKRLNESALLLLELKIKIGSSFPKFDEAQHGFYRALREYGVPIDYCYNLVSDYVGKNAPEYTLSASKLSAPDLLFAEARIVAEGRHLTLKASVDAMLAGSQAGGQDVLGRLISGGVLADVTGLSTRALLLAYHPKQRQFLLLDPDQFIAFAKDIVGGVCIRPLDKAKMADSSYVIHALEEIGAAISRNYEKIPAQEVQDRPGGGLGM